MIAPIRFVMELDALDEGRALFVHRNPSDPDGSRGSMQLIREVWEDHGRPSTLVVTLEEAERTR